MSDLENIAKAEQKKPASEVESLKAETLKLEIEAKKLELLERKANLQDLEERLAERELQREVRRQRNRTNGATLRSLAEADKAAQKRCTHKKGGDGAAAVVGGQGQSSQYAVLKHTFANGDMWVRCLRCGNTWKPPVESDYIDPITGEINQVKLVEATAAYHAAVNFSTLNVTSGACQFRFSDNGKYYREVTKYTTLR
jgi:hypothetical protein